MLLSIRQINMYQVYSSVQGDALGPGVEAVKDTGEQDVTAQTHHYWHVQKETSFNQCWEQWRAFREEGKRDIFQGSETGHEKFYCRVFQGTTYVMDSLLPSKEGGFYWLEDSFSIIPCDGFRNAGAQEAGLLCTWMYKGGGFQEYGGNLD